MTDRDAAWLWDMLDAARSVKRFTQGASLEALKSDDMLRSATERQFQILGEAAQRVSEPLKEEHPEIQWSKNHRVMS